MSTPTVPDPYGVDLLVDQATGDLVVTPGGGLATITGPANMVQALQDRLRTYPGELSLHPDYGSALARQIGGKNGDLDLARTQANTEASRILDADPRVLRATGIDVAADGTRLAVTMTLTLAGGEQLQVTDLADGRIDELDLQAVLDPATAAIDVDDPLADWLDLEGDASLDDDPATIDLLGR